MTDTANDAGQRRPKPEDLEPILDLIWNGKSLRQACAELGLHVPSTSDWLHADDERREQYARAREGRAEYLQEDALTMNRAAALGTKVGLGDKATKVDASGAKGYLEAVKWATGRMAPKTVPVKRIAVQYEDLTPAQRRARIAELEAELAASADDDEAEEPEA